jgi:hypothetical protein
VAAALQTVKNRSADDLPGLQSHAEIDFPAFYQWASRYISSPGLTTKK